MIRRSVAIGGIEALRHSDPWIQALSQSDELLDRLYRNLDPHAAGAGDGLGQRADVRHPLDALPDPGERRVDLGLRLRAELRKVNLPELKSITSITCSRRARLRPECRARPGAASARLTCRAAMPGGALPFPPGCRAGRHKAATSPRAAPGMPRSPGAPAAIIQPAPRIVPARRDLGCEEGEVAGGRGHVGGERKGSSRTIAPSSWWSSGSSQAARARRYSPTAPVAGAPDAVQWSDLARHYTPARRPWAAQPAPVPRLRARHRRRIASNPAEPGQGSATNNGMSLWPSRGAGARRAHGGRLPRPAHIRMRTPRRPARSWTNCQATRPDMPPRVWRHSMASARSASSPISIPKASQ